MRVRALENNTFTGDLVQIGRKPALRSEKSHAIRAGRIKCDQDDVRTLIFGGSRSERRERSVPTEEEKSKDRKYEPPTHHRE
jgi:hypothetical protein